jgi:hypothetical protein
VGREKLLPVALPDRAHCAHFPKIIGSRTLLSLSGLQSDGWPVSLDTAKQTKQKFRTA